MKKRKEKLFNRLSRENQKTIAKHHPELFLNDIDEDMRIELFEQKQIDPECIKYVDSPSTELLTRLLVENPKLVKLVKPEFITKEVCEALFEKESYYFLIDFENIPEDLQLWIINEHREYAPYIRNLSEKASDLIKEKNIKGRIGVVTTDTEPPHNIIMMVEEELDEDERLQELNHILELGLNPDDFDI